MLTTQQAADLLGLSPSTVVRLIEDNELPGQGVADQYLVSLSDLLTFRTDQRSRQYSLLFETFVPLENEDDPVEVLAELKQVRKERAAGRRQRAD